MTADNKQDTTRNWLLLDNSSFTICKHPFALSLTMDESSDGEIN